MENLDLFPQAMAVGAALIVGLAIELSVLGFVDYHAKERGERRRDLLRQPGYQIWVNFGLVLFCLGVLGSSRAWWESVIWVLLAVAFGYYAIAAYGKYKQG